MHSIKTFSRCEVSKVEFLVSGGARSAQGVALCTLQTKYPMFEQELDSTVCRNKNPSAYPAALDTGILFSLNDRTEFTAVRPLWPWHLQVRHQLWTSFSIAVIVGQES